jgi:hypothetical protein
LTDGLESQEHRFAVMVLGSGLSERGKSCIGL